MGPTVDEQILNRAQLGSRFAKPEGIAHRQMIKRFSAVGSAVYGWSEAITDWFVPDSLKTDAATFGLARIFVFSHLFGPALGQSISVYLYVLDPSPGFAYWTVAGLITSFWIFPFSLKLTGGLVPLALCSVQTLTVVTLFGSYYYGGVSSPLLPWLVNALLLLFFYLGDRPRLRYVAICLFALDLAGFYLGYAVHHGFPERVPIAAMSGLGITSVVAATIYMSMMALYYVNVVASRSRLEREVQSHRATAIKLRKAKEAAEAASRTKSEFLAKMSHELRTPLNAVIGYSEMLLEDAESEAQEAQIADLRRINSAGKHLLSLVTDVLDLSKIEAGKMDVAALPFDLNAFVDDVAATCRPLVMDKGNNLVVERPGDLGIAIGDATKLRQAVLNLLSNAAKFTHRGRVVLAVARENAADADWIRIAVRDTGIGISRENLPKLFQEFNQAEASTQSRYGGTGLGLALSQRLCRMMGGEITVESEPGRGSCFTIRVPAMRSASARKIVID
jgi:signal transduction histidine kinase